MLNITMHGRTSEAYGTMLRTKEVGRLWYTMEPIRVNFMI